MAYLPYLYHKNQPNVGKYSVHGAYMSIFIYLHTSTYTWMSQEVSKRLVSGL